jgi:phosphopantetheinyl transferase
MPLLQKHASPLWGIWKIEECWEELLSRFERPEMYLPFLNQFKSEKRKAEWLSVRLLLKELLETETAIAYRDTGAPYLPDSSFHISISHTKGFAAVLLSPDKSVGIDIEYCTERIQRVKSRFLRKDEFALLPKNPSTNELLVCWSAKETAFKMTEQQTADMQEDIHIIDFKPSRQGNSGTLTVRENLTPQSSVFHINYLITSDFVVTHSEAEHYFEALGKK